MLFVPERRRHDSARGVVPIGIEIFAFVQRQVLDQRLAPNPLALHAGAADGLVRFFARGMNDIQRYTRHVGDHNRAVGRLALDLGRAGIGMTFGSGVPLGQKLGGHFGDNVTVFGMHHRNTAKFGQTVERCEQFVIVHHQRALIGKEVFERVDTALFNDRFHVVENLFAPPCDRHVERIVTIRACGFVVPPFDRVHQAFALVRQTEINDHRCTTGQAGACAAFEIVAGIGAHERHF